MVLAIGVVLAAGLAVGGSLLLHRMFPPPDPAALRQRLEAAGAMPVFIRVSSRVASGERVDWDDADARALSNAGVHVWQAIRTDDGVVAVQFEFGGAESHYGLIVDEAGVRLGDVVFGDHVERWDRRMWFYSELRPRER